MNLRLASYTLGCKVNQYETEAIIGEFLKNGFSLLPFREKADVYLINSCTVTAKSDKESKYSIRLANRLNPQAKIIVTGCLAQRQPAKLANLPGVVLVAGNLEKDRIFSLFKKAKALGETQAFVRDIQSRCHWDNLKIERFYTHTRAFVKIQDGCDAGCHYCLVPQVRGKPCSRPLDEVKKEIQRLIKQGVKEIVLTGIRLGRYGEDLYPRTTLARLLEYLDKEAELKRMRLSSIEPGEVNQELIQQIAGSQKVCPHFHIPLQSGDNEILHQMGRTYTREEYLDVINKIKEELPQATFSTDIMVGYPGEEERHFHNTIDLIKKIGFIHLHIFTFSPRESTQAANFPQQLSLSIKKRRSQKLQALAKELESSYWKTQKDKALEVLVEKKDKFGNLSGLTKNYLRVSFPGDFSLVNQLVKVRISEFPDRVFLEH